jgi:ubiquinone/menaquinone biosynthesis C-methylase UbiE
MQRSEGEYLIISEDDLQDLKEALSSAAPDFRSAKAAIYSFRGLIPPPIRAAIASAARLQKRLMDRAVFLVQKDSTAQQILYSEFFEYVAADYDSLIDPQRNMDNIDQLITMLAILIDGISGKSIMDFGCGTGLAFELLQKAGARFVGVDQSGHMREMATRRGMKSCSPNDLSDYNSFFDGAIASYVLHLISTDDAIATIVKPLKPGGVLVGNYHKSWNIYWADEAFRRQGCEVIKLASGAASQHGSYVGYIKR